MIMINESKPNHMLFKPKMHNYNKKVTTNSNNSNKLLSPMSQAPQVANSVVIIHQNNSISTNCEPVINTTTSTPIKTQPVLNKPDEAARSATVNNNNMVLNNGNDNDLNELKYMKGYVNVLKERFTRKTNENEKNGPTMEHILHRRSISPYAINKASHSTVKSPPSNVMNENTKKLFTSSDDLRNPVKIVTNCGSLVKNKIKYLSNTALNTASSVSTSHHGASSGCLLSPNSDYKCGISYDKINKDELPKPNFVSSVKNLFEKQIHNAACSSSLNNSLNTSTSNHAASVDFNKLNSSFNNSTATAASSTSLTKSPVVQSLAPTQPNNQYDISLVDRLRQNGTVVYEHADTNSQQSNGLDKRESLNQQSQQQNSVSVQLPVSNPTSPFNNKSNSANSNNCLNSTKLFVVSSKSKPPAPPPPSLPPPSIKKSPLLPSNSNTIHNHHHSNNSQNDSDKENENSTNVNSTSNTTDPNRFLTIKERKEFFSKPSTSVVQPGRLQKRFKSESSVSNDWSTRTSDNSEHVAETEVKSPVRMNGHANRSTTSSNIKISSSESQVMIEDAHSNETADYDDQIDAESNELGVDEDDNSISANQILTSAKQKKEINTKAKTNVKMKTFFGGEEIKNLDELKSMKPVVGPTRTSNDNSDSSGRMNHSIEFFNFEFIGAEVKLEKSILIVRRQDSTSTMSNKKFKKVERVNFVEEAPETYEYPSFEFMLKEMGIDPANDPDYQIVPGESEDESNHEDDDDQENNRNKKPSYTQFLPGLITESSDFDDSKNNTYNKLGSFTNFKPSCLTTSYELGSIESFEKRLSGHYDHMKAEYEETSKDILPSREEDLKRWSCEMDANILF